MHQFVLSLPDSRMRRMSAIRLMQQSGIEFEMVDGVEVSKLRLDTIAYDPEVLTWAKLGSLGCYFGHLRILQRLVDYGLPYACIVEDDLCLEADPEFGLREIEAHLPRSFDHIRLQRNLSLNSKYRVVGPPGPFQRVCETEYCATGYIIARRLAQHILNHHSVCRMPIDHLYAELSLRGEFYETRKPLVGIQQGLPSDIHPNRESPAS